MKHESSAGVVIYTRAPEKQTVEYLLLHYPGGHWGFPKGKVEKGEDLRKAAVREVQEETGLEVIPVGNFSQSITYYFRDRDGTLVDKEVTFFVAEVDTKEVTLSQEHHDYVWLPVEPALEKLTYNNSRQLLRMVNQYVDARLQGETG